MFHNIKLITIDVVNTLIKVNGAVGSIYVNAAKKLFPSEFISIDIEMEKKIESEFLKIYKQYYVNYPNFGYGKITSQKFWHCIISDVFRNVGYDLNSEKMNQLTGYLYNDFTSKRHWSVFDEVRDVLSQLAHSDIKVGIVSNFDQRLSLVLKDLELDHYFDFIVCSGVCGHAKPSNRIFELALKQTTNFLPESCIHIGDNTELDYKAARAVGMNALIINRKDSVVNDPIPQDHCIKSLRCIRTIIN